MGRYVRWDGVGGGFSVVEAEPGPVGVGEVLVRVDLATVCGSDLHTVRGRRVSPVPGVLGHEQVGTVVAVGGGVVAVDGRPVVVGERVVWSVTASCLECDRCVRGMTQKCRRLRKYGHEPLDEAAPFTGGFATHCLLLPGTAVVRVPDGLPDQVASPAACATATVAAVLAAVPRGVGGLRVMVAGAGMLGLTAVAMAKEAGARVLAVDPHPDRRARALVFGAEETAAAPSEGGVDVAVELSGKSVSVQACLDALDIGGTLVLAGSVAPDAPVRLDPEKVVRGLHTVVGVHNYRAKDLQAAVDFLREHHRAYPFHELVNGAFGLSDIDKAFAAALDGTAPRQAVLP